MIEAGLRAVGLLAACTATVPIVAGFALWSVGRGVVFVARRRR